MIQFTIRNKELWGVAFFELINKGFATRFKNSGIGAITISIFTRKRHTAVLADDNFLHYLFQIRTMSFAIAVRDFYYIFVDIFFSNGIFTSKRMTGCI